MSRFVNNAITDIRHGRESWRVFVFLGFPCFLLAILTASIHTV
jgi:hypothetical protein